MREIRGASHCKRAGLGGRHACNKALLRLRRLRDRFTTRLPLICGRHRSPVVRNRFIDDARLAPESFACENNRRRSFRNRNRKRPVARPRNLSRGRRQNNRTFVTLCDFIIKSYAYSEQRPKVYIYKIIDLKKLNGNSIHMLAA